MNGMKAVVLAGGNGNRVYPLAVNKPKPLFKVLDKPLMQCVVEALAKAGLKDLVVVIGHNAEQVKDFFGDGKRFGCKIRYAFQKDARGMADALMTTKKFVGERFVVVNADDIFEPALLKRATKEKADLVLATKPVKETWKYGVVDKDSRGNVKKIVEKPPAGKEPSNQAVVGVYVLPKEIFAACESLPTSDDQFEKAIQSLIDKGRRVKAVSYEGFFGSYKYAWDLFKLNEHFLETLKPRIARSAKISKKAVIKGRNVWIGENVRVFDHAVIEEPCYIGDNAVIGNNSLIRNYSTIGEGSVIGYGSEIKHSLVGDNCWTHSAYVGDSIIGDNCSLGAGTVTANLRFDKKNVTLRVLGKKERMDTGSNKFGVVMADNCKVGSNSTLMPGTKMGPHSIVGPGVLLLHDLPPNKIVFVKEQVLEVRDNKITLDRGKEKELKRRLLKYAKV